MSKLPSSSSIKATIKFHRKLNPAFWRGDQLRTEVRLKLFQSALAFYRFLDIPGLVVKDIILTGSNAAFNYTALSDLDVHLVVNFSHTACPELADNFFTTKKSLWSQIHDVAIYGHPVELYVEDTAKPATANGVYSLLHSRWLKPPTQEPPRADDSAVAAKVKAYADEIDRLLESTPEADEIRAFLNRLRTLRQAGLLHGGEFSVENLTFKSLRALGYIPRLVIAQNSAADRSLSL